MSLHAARSWRPLPPKAGVSPNQIPTKLVFHWSTLAKLPVIFSTFRKNPNKNHTQVWALCRSLLLVAVWYWNFYIFTIPRRVGDRGRLLSTLPARRVWQGPALSPKTLCRPVGRAWPPGGARESPSKPGILLKSQNDTTTISALPGI